jgi:hypothetical protein
MEPVTFWFLQLNDAFFFVLLSFDEARPEVGWTIKYCGFNFFLICKIIFMAKKWIFGSIWKR